MDCLVYQCIDWLLLSLIDGRKTARRTSKQTQAEVLTWCAQLPSKRRFTGPLKPDHFRSKAKPYPENVNSRQPCMRSSTR